MKSLKATYIAENCALLNAIHRCHNDKHQAFKNYGARGIKVCDEWRDPKTGFAAFLEHIGPRPTDSHTLDRIDNDGNYEPGNVRWADRITQQSNRRPSRVRITDYGWGIGLSSPRGSGQGYCARPSALLPFQGRVQTIADWCLELGLKGPTVRQRLERGLSPEQALSSANGTGKFERPKAEKPHSELPVPAPHLDDPEVRFARTVGAAIDLLTDAVEQFKGRLH